VQTINLNGTWQLRWDDGQRGGHLARYLDPTTDMSNSIPAEVPGEVHMDMMRAGLLAEPGEGLNCLSARWVEQAVWFYRRTFDAPALADGERAFLVCEALDLAAVVYVNGIEVGKHNNVFYPCAFDVTEQLRAGENILLIAVESGMLWAIDKQSNGYGMSFDSVLRKRNWLRKTQSQFGWDWSPQLVNVGVTGGVRLEICADARLEQATAVADLDASLQRGTVTGRVFVQGLGAEPQEATLTVRVAGRESVQAVTVAPGANRLEAQVVVEQPDLWWPVGHGSQPLYAVEISLNIGGKEIAAATRRVGFRRAVICQDAHPVKGQYFYIEINGKPIFAKGGDFVPADFLFARIDRPRYATLVDRALEANFNLLRIWGGGLYEGDDFYEVCDERGVMVWQEFIFACAKYPVIDDAYLTDVKAEATYQVRRLASHPSLVVWCGNNEMEWGNYNWNYDQGVAYPDYALFHLLLPLIVRNEDGTRYYQPSSPWTPNLGNPNDDYAGDQHPWSIGFVDTDFRKYRLMECRFPNEGGILGPTALPTVRACLPAGQDRPGSFAFEVHDNSVSYWQSVSYPDQMIEQWVGKRVSQMSVEDYVYWGGVVQGAGLSEYIRNFRRRMFDSGAACFWMYNDCWPATRSWTVVDYYLRRTPAFWPVRRACQPVAVFAVEEGDCVRVYGVNEGAACDGELRYGLAALAGGYPLDERRQVHLPANSSTPLAEFSIDTWPRLGLERHVAFALLAQDAREISRDVLFLPFYKEMAWPVPAVSVRQEHGKAIFASETFAWRVCLDLDGERPLPDNFFDVLPGIPTVLDWPVELGSPRVLRVGDLTA
jgi:beta-mannosidase